jgi:hypothetical protein
MSGLKTKAMLSSQTSGRTRAIVSNPRRRNPSIYLLFLSHNSLNLITELWPETIHIFCGDHSRRGFHCKAKLNISKVFVDLTIYIYI